MEHDLRNDKLIKELCNAIWKKYYKNEHKGSWASLNTNELYRLLLQEVVELMNSIEEKDFVNAIDEAADIALFASFLADPNRDN